ncbi:MAG: ComEC/Rec2 family competence protein [Clostridia bacterium]|nr:ComEC/Rec2 family competence protein [Clostridia bacterium]
MIFALLSVVGLLLKNQRIRILSACLCLIAVITAMSNSFLRIDMVKARAEKYQGDQIVVCDVIDESYSSEYSSSYRVRINQIGNETVSFKAVAVFDFKADLCVGDRLYAKTTLYGENDSVMGVSLSDNSEDVLLFSVEDPAFAVVEKFNKDIPKYKYITEQNGLRVIMHDIKQGLNNHVNDLFGEQSGAVVNGFLLGDTTDIPTDVIRDFRRSGVSHLLAVSGLHISILLGALDLLLKKLYVHKNIRIVVVTVMSFAFLALVGFSMSAVRCVFMLWIAYIIFMISEEADPPTTLFVAVTLILIILPYSVYSLGFWMSFLATLGLVTVYPVFENVIPKTKHRSKLISRFFKIGRSAILICAMTIISNMFLLPIQWKFFREISVVSIPSNLILSPITSLYLIISVITLITSSIPVIGDILVIIVQFLSGVIVWITNKLSSFDFATVSLGYWFADYLIAGFVIFMLVLMVVKLSKKWLLFLPLISFVVVFTACVSIFNYSAPKGLYYSGNDTSKTISLYESGSTCIIDGSGGKYNNFSSSYYKAKEYGCTYVDMIVFTDVTKNHISSMEYFLRSNVVKKIYIPIPNEDDEKQINLAIEMTRLANQCKTQVYLYKSGETLSLDNIRFRIDVFEIEQDKALSLFVSGGQDLYGYVDVAALSVNDFELHQHILNSDTLVFGNNNKSVEEMFYCDVSENTTIIYTSFDIAEKSSISSNTDKTYYSNLKWLYLYFKIN